MTSKNSFWVSIREDNKRRTWLWAVSLLFFLLYYGAGTLLTISSNKSFFAGQNLPAETQTAFLLEHVILFYRNHLPLMFGAAVIAVLAALQGFSYLYHRERIDLYHSLPVKKSRRFAEIWLNGILIFLIPCLIGVAGGILAAAVQGLMTMEIIKNTAFILLGTLILYLALYHLTLIAVMLTGHIIVTIFGVLIFQFYEYLLQWLIMACRGNFYDKYFNYLGREIHPRLSPYWYYLSSLSTETISMDAPGFYLNMADFFGEQGKLLLLAILLGAIAYLLYCKRPSEAAGRAMTFEITKPVIKVGLVVPMALFSALFVYSMTNTYDLSFALGALIMSAIGCCLIEVIYEFDIKACLRKKRYIPICFLLASLIYLGYRFDITGFDDYVPDPADVESYALAPIDVNNGDFFREDGSYTPPLAYMGERMLVADSEAICRLAAIQPPAPVWPLNESPDFRNVEEIPAGERVDEAMPVRYRLKSGRIVERLVYLNYSNPETEELLNRIVSTPEYKKGALMAMADYYDNWLRNTEERKVSATMRIGAYEYRIPPEALSEIVSVYRDDLRSLNYTDIYKSLPTGYIFWENEPQNEFFSEMNNAGSYGIIGSYTNTHLAQMIRIYPGCTRTIELLRDLGIYREELLSPEDVERVEITYEKLNDSAGQIISHYYPNEYYSAAYSYDTSMQYPEGERVTLYYTDPGEILEVSRMIWHVYESYNERTAEHFDAAYQVTVYFKVGSNPYEHGSPTFTYSVLKDKMPNFIRDALQAAMDEQYP